MRSAQQKQSDRPPANAVRTPNNNYSYMNGSPRGPQPVPSNGYVYFFFYITTVLKDKILISLLHFRISSDEKERLRRLKEMKSKQVEMEAMREAEMKLKRKVC